MKYLHLLRKLSRGPIVLALPLALAMGLASCSETTAPYINEGGMLPPPPIIGPQQSLYSLSGANLEQATSSAADDAVRGQRWCGQVNLWFDPAAGICAGHGGQPPFGSVSTVDGDLVVSGGTARGAPLVWTGPPSRVNPFPDSGDFTLEVRMKVDGLAVYGSGLHVREWNPAVTEGSSNPNYEKVLVVWADGASGLWVQLLGQVTKAVSGSKNWHTYRLVHEAGLYTLFVDDVKVAGPMASERRPTGLWLGNPNFMTEARDWTDWRLSQLTVTSPEPEITEIEVPVDVKPGSCPSQVNIDANGVVPVAIAGTADLDVSRIDASTLRLAGVAPQGSAIEDVGGPAEPYIGKTVDDCAPEGADGHPDLTVKFSNQDLAEAIGPAADGDVRTLALTGNLLPEFGGTPIVGEDVIVLQVPKNVSVDVQPGACPSPVNMKAGGLLPVAIAGGEDLDVSRIDISSLRLEEVAGERSSVDDVTGAVAPLVGRLVEDCSVGGPDGFTDLVVGFANEAIASAMGDVVHGETRTLHLTGNLLPEFGGTPLVGEDVVVAQTPLEVSLDIKPGACPAPINRRANGALPVAIAGMDGVDLGMIEVASLRLEGVATERAAWQDVTAPVAPFVGRTADDCGEQGRGDGVQDLTLQFPSRLVAEAIADAEKGDVVTLTLTGFIVTESGRRPIVGEDIVRIVK